MVMKPVTGARVGGSLPFETQPIVLCVPLHEPHEAVPFHA